MADQPSIFGSDVPATQPTPQAAVPNVPANDPVTTLLASVRNERGEQKYKDVQEAFIGLKHAQEYIPTLKNDLTAKEQALAAALQRNAELEEAQRSLLALTSQPPVVNPPVAQPVFDESKIAEMVQQTLSQREQASRQQANIQSVVSTLQHVFGADAEQAYNRKAVELGMSVNDLNSLAAKSPQAVFNMLGINGQAKQGNTSPTPGSINPAAYQPTPNSFVGRNTKSLMLGATTEDIHAEFHNSRSMVSELHAQGLSVHDLSDPKAYNKFFNRKQ